MRSSLSGGRTELSRSRRCCRSCPKRCRWPASQLSNDAMELAIRDLQEQLLADFPQESESDNPLTLDDAIVALTTAELSTAELSTGDAA